jgi:hypothetical protein
MSRQILEDDYIGFHLREMERDVNMIKRNAEAIFRILDGYENLVKSKLDV